MTRLYRFLLFAYPEPMRQAFGGEMVELFADLLREERRRGGFIAAVFGHRQDVSRSALQRLGSAA